MSFTLCSSNAIVRNAGLYANSTAVASNALLSDYCDKAESEVCMKSRYDWVANYSSVGTNYKPALAKAVASLAAIEVIRYDMSGYTSRMEVTTMIDILADQANKIIADLKEKNIQEVMI